MAKAPIKPRVYILTGTCIAAGAILGTAVGLLARELIGAGYRSPHLGLVIGAGAGGVVALYIRARFLH